MHTLDEVAALLGLREIRMLRKYLQLADIVPTVAPGDRRRKLLSDADVAALRSIRETLRPPVSRSAGQQVALPVHSEGVDLAARIASLERRVATLEAHAARRVATPAPAEPREPIAMPSDIPDGALQAGPFAQQIGVPETTLRRWVERGDIEAVNRASRIPGHTERWLTLAGQQQARERAASRRGA